jgi:thiosulfate dehydrogenase (quinone) large subunit
MATIAQGPATAAAPASRTSRQTTEAVSAISVRERATRYIMGGLRIALGWIFLWAFLDKLFGLGHETTSKAAWINGGSPTKGFLSHATGPLSDFYTSFAGAAWANVLFMVGLAALGVALISGVGVRIAAVAGSVLLVLMFGAALPPANNVFMDDHLIYAGLLVALALTNAGDTLGIGRWWGRTSLVKTNPWLK